VILPLSFQALVSLRSRMESSEGIAELKLLIFPLKIQYSICLFHFKLGKMEFSYWNSNFKNSKLNVCFEWDHECCLRGCRVFHSMGGLRSRDVSSPESVLALLQSPSNLTLKFSLAGDVSGTVPNYNGTATHAYSHTNLTSFVWLFVEHKDIFVDISHGVFYLSSPTSVAPQIFNYENAILQSFRHLRLQLRCCHNLSGKFAEPQF